MHSPWRLIGKLGVMPRDSLYSGRLRSAESLIYMSLDAALSRDTFFLGSYFSCLDRRLRNSGKGVSWLSACRERERFEEAPNLETLGFSSLCHRDVSVQDMHFVPLFAAVLQEGSRNPSFYSQKWL